MKALSIIRLVTARVLVTFVRGYQRCVSPLLPPTCRFEPSCSQYMIEAIRKKGPVAGLLKGLFRLMRCHPLSRGGYDPVERDKSPTAPQSPAKQTTPDQQL